MIVIVDYGMGNVGSIRNMLKRIGVDSVVSSDLDAIEAARMLILPGVGAFDSGMRRLQELSLLPLLNKKVLQQQTPILGICLGMQLLTKGSEEGQLPGLGWIDGKTIRFRLPAASSLKTPHMGWNYVEPIGKPEMWSGLARPRYYFVHSYHVQCNREQDVLATANHGGEFAAAIGRENIIGVQFHPEKSHRFGMTLLQNILRNSGHVSSACTALSAA